MEYSKLLYWCQLRMNGAAELIENRGTSPIVRPLLFPVLLRFIQHKVTMTKCKPKIIQEYWIAQSSIAIY